MKRGLSAASPSASRSRLTALFKLLSNSTNESSGHKRCCRFCRVTSSPGHSSSALNTWNDLSCRRIFAPLRRSSPLVRSKAKTPNLIGSTSILTVELKGRGYHAAAPDDFFSKVICPQQVAVKGSYKARVIDLRRWAAESAPANRRR